MIIIQTGMSQIDETWEVSLFSWTWTLNLFNYNLVNRKKISGLIYGLKLTKKNNLSTCF